MEQFLSILLQTQLLSLKNNTRKYNYTRSAIFLLFTDDFKRMNSKPLIFLCQKYVLSTFVVHIKMFMDGRPNLK